MAPSYDRQMPGLLWYFLIAFAVFIGVMLAVPSDGAPLPPPDHHRPEAPR